MIQINPDPHTSGYVYVPTHAVTAFFPAGVSVEPIVRALKDAGFAGDHVEIFTGAQGATKLDAEGHRHGLWVRFLRSLEETFGEDYDEFAKADQILRSGGTVVSVHTHKDAAKKCQAAELLLAQGGQDVMYWGKWAREFFSVGTVSIPNESVGEAGLKVEVERDLRTVEDLAARLHRQAERAGSIGLETWGNKLKVMATDADRHVREFREMLAGS